MHDPEEHAELVKRYERLLHALRSPEVRGRMMANGPDPGAVLKQLTAQKDKALAADEATEKAVEQREDLVEAWAELMPKEPEE